jgi:hypothetical protein
MTDVKAANNSLALSVRPLKISGQVSHLTLTSRHPSPSGSVTTATLYAASLMTMA